MRGKPPGSIVSLYFDSPTLMREDDVIRTESGKCYRVVSNRVQERGKHVGRQHLTCRVIEEAEVTADDFVMPIYWYARPRRR
jgi:hypothetical protein